MGWNWLHFAKSVEFGDSWRNTTYSVTQGNRIRITYDVFNYLYDINSDKMNICDDNWNVQSWAVKYVRVKNKGPQSIEFLFTGDKNKAEEALPSIQASKSSKENKDSEDWNAVLDSYEKYIDNYITYAKKAAKGDASAITKVASLMEDVEELSDKLEKAEDDMSSSQMARFTRITSKFTEAMMTLE